MTRHLALALLLSAGVPLAAQTTKPAPAAARADSAITDTARTHAAGDLLDALDVQAQMSTMEKGMLDQMAAGAHPAIRQVIDAWLEKYFSYASIRNDLVQIYAREFTADELRQLGAFMRSPVGHHFTSASASLMEQGMKLGQRAAEEHRAELQTALQQKISELQQQAGKP